MKAMIYGAGGGTSSDEVTALKKHVLSPYTTITNDSGDEIVAGTMIDNGAVNRSLKCGERYTIVEGFHNGSGVISADSLASQTGANAAAGDILTGKTAWVNGIKLTGTLPMMAGGTKTPSTSQITVACSGYKMTSNIIIPAFSLPDKSKLISGYTYKLYGKSVTGTAQQYIQTSSNVTKSSGGGVTLISGAEGTVNFTSDTDIVISLESTTSNITARVDNAFNLSNYKYLKIQCKQTYGSAGTANYIRIGVSTESNNTNVTWSDAVKVPYSSSSSPYNTTVILDISNLTGMYFLYINGYSATSKRPTFHGKLFLSNT